MWDEKTKSISDRFRDIPLGQVIDIMAAWAIANGLPIAIYSLPNQKTFNCLIGSTITKIQENDLASVDAGFLISSYDGDQYFIDEGINFNSLNKEIRISPTWPNQILLDLFDQNNTSWKPYATENTLVEIERKEYVEQVNQCIDVINNSNLIKVVPSRIMKVNLPDNFNLSRTFLDLCDKYDNAFVSLLSTPELGTWLGATPETLIEVDRNGIFKTMSLAGTQAYDNEQLLHTLPWTEKEIEEQAMVSRYIINRFKEIRLREFEEVGPRTVRAGNLAHLCSIFTVDTKATDHPNLGSVMLNLLHPTSAVCGMPKDKAQILLKSLEKHQRKLYSGYFGPVNMQEGSHIYVNLRCMEVFNREAILYAGAGVTAYSIAEDEWQETELKCKTLLNIILQ